MEHPEAQRATRILQEALEASPSRRVEFARERCGSDAALLEEVLSLLRVAERAGDFLETPAVIAMTTGLARESDWAGLGAGDSVGPYRIVRRVGTGGMGDVYLAEQREPIARRVAMKIVKPGMDTRAVLSRFRQEQRTLSLLAHPCIARVYDAGSTARGLPFFVMEFVDGEPITLYCRDRDLDLDARLNLFRQVCAAVHHAHQKGVIHRDLKPSNVLVEVADGAARAKVIDFGIAKALAEGESEASLVTGAGQFIGTPEYMAPEQAAGDADVRSDVFSLGVMLYELLTGTLPVDRERVRRMTGQELGAYLGSTTPKRPSTALADLTRTGGAAGRLPGSLPRELDWIVMKTLERDPVRRYASVAALSDDLGRALRHEPVEAGPPSKAYRASKFIRRNRAAVLGASIAALALIAGAVAASIGMVRAVESGRLAESRLEDSRASEARAKSAQGEAERAARHAERVSGFLQRMLLTIRPETARGMDTTLLRQMVEEAESSIESEFGDVPEAEADIRLTMARIFGASSEWDKAEMHATRALELYTRLKGPGDADTIACMDWIAAARDARGDLEGAIRLSEDALEHARTALGPDHETTITCMNNLGNMYVAAFRLDEAEPLLQAAYEHRIAVHGPEDSSALSTLSNLATLRERQGRVEESISILEECVEIRTRAFGEDHPQTIGVMNNLSSMYQIADRYEDAEAMLERTLELSDRVNGPEHSFTLAALNNLGSLYKSTGRLEQAEPIFRRAVAGLERRMGPDAFETLATRRNLAEVLGLLGQLDEAEIILRDVVKRCERVLVPEHPLNAVAPVVLSILLSRKGEVADAYRVLDDAWTRIGELPEPGNSARPQVLQGLVFLSERLGFDAEHARWSALMQEFQRPTGP